MIASTPNGLDLLLAALVIAGAFICWLILQDIDHWTHYEDPFTVARDEIRALDEVVDGESDAA